MIAAALAKTLSCVPDLYYTNRVVVVLDSQFNCSAALWHVEGC